MNASRLDTIVTVVSELVMSNGCSYIQLWPWTWIASPPSTGDPSQDTNNMGPVVR